MSEVKVVKPRPQVEKVPGGDKSSVGEARSDASPAALPTPDPSERLSVRKTYKLYLGGRFTRSESGQSYGVRDDAGESLARVSRASRKDFRDAVVAARAAQPAWAARSAYNRGQIVYRIAEMLEGRRDQFTSELVRQGVSAHQAEAEVLEAIDRVVYYAGWADKFQQVFSCVNPVSSSHFNFSLLEPMGVVAILAPEEGPLLGLLSVVLPSLVGGNACTVLASETRPLCAVTLSEVLHASDVPGGVFNLLTSRRQELLEPFATHMDVNAVVYCGSDAAEVETIQAQATTNLKRVVLHDERDWQSKMAQSPYCILDTQEVKTTWHPIGG